MNFCGKFFCLTVPEKIRRGTLLCFTVFLVSKTFLEKRGLGE